jgi:hypothetical protein
MAIVQENEPGIPVQLMTAHRKPGPLGRLRPATFSLRRLRAVTGRLAYFGGVFESGGGDELGGVEAGLSGVELLGGVVVSPGAAVLPGAVDWSEAGGGEVVVSAGAELAEPAGEVDSCLEQAPNSASEPTHNNRTLRFIRSPHYCNGTVTRALPAWTQRPLAVASRVPRRCIASHGGNDLKAKSMPKRARARSLISFAFSQGKERV